jgi:hypothetical protein
MSNLAIMAGVLPAVPRSALHALAPAGLATPQVESLTSYFCRLANSHACTTHDLAKFVIDRIEPERWETHQGTDGKSRFVWYERSISGLGDAALNWVGMLAQLTGVDTLQHLTLLPLQGCVAPKGLMANQARWCPQCLAEDRQAGRQPYFRLAWDIGLNRVCVQHGTALVARCPHCKLTNVRHTANVVVPGWCTACGHFLGNDQARPLPESVPSPGDGQADVLTLSQPGLDTARATHIGALLAATSSPQSAEFSHDSESLHRAVEHLINELDGGVAAHFAKRLGVRKSTVHYWHTAHTPLTLDALTRIALYCHVTLAQLLQGKLDRWRPPAHAQQQMALLPTTSEVPRYRKRSEHDWPTIRRTLREELLQPEPRSVTEVAKSLSIDTRLLYIRATQEARQLGEYYVHCCRAQASRHQAALHKELFQACVDLRREGEGVTVREVEQRVGTETINQTRHLYTVLTDLAHQAANDGTA